VQLSDIHIADSNDVVFARPKEIVAAIRSLLYEASAAIVLVTGDVAFSGEESQYLSAIDLLDALKKAISRRADSLGPTLPPRNSGNHDCDFSVATSN